MGNSKYIRPELTELNMSWVVNLVSGSSKVTEKMAKQQEANQNAWGNNPFASSSRERATMNDGTDVDWDF